MKESVIAFIVGIVFGMGLMYQLIDYFENRKYYRKPKTKRYWR